LIWSDIRIGMNMQYEWEECDRMVSVGYLWGIWGRKRKKYHIVKHKLGKSIWQIRALCSQEEWWDTIIIIIIIWQINQVYQGQRSKEFR
jgi:hypothetical protein